MKPKLLYVADLQHVSGRAVKLLPYISKEYDVEVLTPAQSLFKANNIHNVIVHAYKSRYDIWSVYRTLFRLIKNDDSTAEYQNGYVSSRSKLVKGIMKFCMNLYRDLILAFPDDHVTCIKPALRKGELILENNNFELIYSSSPHPSAHIIASKLARKYHIKWVAEFRDPWSLNHFYEYSVVHKLIDKYLEKKTLKNVNACVFLSPDYVNKIKYNDEAKYEVITNGFDSYIEKSNVRNEKFNIIYAGLIYNEKQDLVPLLDVIQDMIDSGRNEICINIYGPPNNEALRLVKRESLQEYVKFKGMVDNNSIKEKQSEADLLLMLNWEDARDGVILQTKMFEYMGTNIPVLATGGTECEKIDFFFSNSKMGLSSRSTNEIFDFISDLYDRWSRGEEIKFNRNISFVEKYRTHNIGDRLISFLKGV